MSGKLDKCCDLIAAGLSRREAMDKTGVKWETQLSRHIRFKRPELRGQPGRPRTQDASLASLIEQRVAQLRAKQAAVTAELLSLDKEIARCEAALEALRSTGENS